MRCEGRCGDGMGRVASASSHAQLRSAVSYQDFLCVRLRYRRPVSSRPVSSNPLVPSSPSSLSYRVLCRPQITALGPSWFAGQFGLSPPWLVAAIAGRSGSGAHTQSGRGIAAPDATRTRGGAKQVSRRLELSRSSLGAAHERTVAPWDGERDGEVGFLGSPISSTAPRLERTVTARGKWSPRETEIGLDMNNKRRHPKADHGPTMGPSLIPDSRQTRQSLSTTQPLPPRLWRRAWARHARPGCSPAAPRRPRPLSTALPRL